MPETKRNAHMELLRIIAMLMIIVHHLIYYSGLLNIEAGFNRYIAQFFNMGGKLGVNLYVMIGAWHMSAKEYSIRRTARIWLQTVMTGLTILVLSGCVWDWKGIGSVKDAFLQMLLPVSRTGYWFAGTYIILTVLMPFLNVIVRSVGRKGLDVLLGMMTFSMSVIPTLMIGKTTYFSPIFWFVYLYLLIGRLRRFPLIALAKHGMKLLAAGVGFIFASTLLLGHINADPIYDINYYANRMETLPMLAASLGLFMAFVRKRPRENKLLERLGGCCFGVYLIHDNPYLRSHIWGEMVKAGAFAQSKLFFVYVLIVPLAIFAAAAIAERIRKMSIGRAEDWLLMRLNRPMQRFDEMMKKELPRVYRKKA